MVRNRFDGSWCSGFEVHEVGPNWVVVRRVSDGGLMRPMHPTEIRENLDEDRQLCLGW
jgi:hypothetical protein